MSERTEKPKQIIVLKNGTTIEVSEAAKELAPSPYGYMMFDNDAGDLIEIIGDKTYLNGAEVQ